MSKGPLIAFTGLAVAVVGVGCLVLMSVQHPVDAVSPQTAGPASSMPPLAAPGQQPSGPLPSPIGADPAPTGSPDEQYSSEVLPPSKSSDTGLPPPRPVQSMSILPLPATAHATGAIVAGFPSAVIPTAPDSVISSSAVAVEGVHLQADLVATTSLAIPDLVNFYRTAFAGYGLYDSPTLAAGAATTVAFTGEGNSITVIVSSVNGSSSYVVYGSLTASG